VELKTDSFSRRDNQNAYLDAARQVGLPALIDGILKIVAATKAKHKYCCLLRLLERLSLVVLPDNLDEAMKSHHWASAIDACLPHVVNSSPSIPLEVLFLQPISTGPGEIGFSELADWLDKRDRAAQRFAQSLRGWATVTAGRLSIGGN
jgi:hypothetical protein